METHVVIMAGGIGSRLWPLSTPEMPKQFIDILGVGKSLIQLTVERFAPLCPMGNFWVVTSEKYADIVREQLPGIPGDNILLEPEARNTAPCIAYACSKISMRHPDANIVVTPSDALILNAEAFRSGITKALQFTGQNDGIVTVGITPTRPETGYGYIHTREMAEMEICKVAGFREKPDHETAQKYLADGTFLWNAGIFVWNVHTIEAQLRRHAPQIMGVMDEMAASFYTDSEEETVRRLFPTCEKISIDYAVMEKSENIFVIPCNPGWSDLGSWTSVHEHLSRDNSGNAFVGRDIRLPGCSNCVVHTDDMHTVIAEGLDHYIIAQKNGKLLICRLSEEQNIKKFLENK